VVEKPGSASSTITGSGVEVAVAVAVAVAVVVTVVVVLAVGVGVSVGGCASSAFGINGKYTRGRDASPTRAETNGAFVSNLFQTIHAAAKHKNEKR
jgi:hypothetical protein